MNITTVRATRIGSHAHRYLSAEPRTGLVVSEFRNGFAALLDEGSDPGFVTFQPTMLPLHPWAVELDPMIRPRLNSACHIRDQVVSLAPAFHIDISAAEITELKIQPWGARAIRHAQQRIPELQQTIEEAPSVWTSRALGPGVSELLKGLPSTGIVEPLMAAIGQGPGSTPSGDDYAVGQLAVQWAMHRASRQAERQLKGLQRLCQWEHLKERTPIGSAQMILAAAAGQFPESVCYVMRALGMDPSRSIYTPARVLALEGVTSGTATLAGILDGLRYLAR
ncbi:DUF2877 domain-containing protein [Candidatus Bipolaricaulota bacterium]